MEHRSTRAWAQIKLDYHRNTIHNLGATASNLIVLTYEANECTTDVILGCLHSRLSMFLLFSGKKCEQCNYRYGFSIISLQKGMTWDILFGVALARATGCQAHCPETALAFRVIIIMSRPLGQLSAVHQCWRSQCPSSARPCMGSQRTSFEVLRSGCRMLWPASLSLLWRIFVVISCRPA